MVKNTSNAMKTEHNHNSLNSNSINNNLKKTLKTEDKSSRNTNDEDNLSEESIPMGINE